MAGLVPAISIPDTRAMRQFYVYILADRPGGSLYVGVTGNLVRRVYEHKQGLVPGHAKRARIDMLVYFEQFATAQDAIRREKDMRRWPNTAKARLIGQSNPQWRDLYAEISV